MRNKEKKKTEQGLINSLEQAKYSFVLLLKKNQKEELINGIFSLLEKLDNPELENLLNNYPDLLQKYNFKELLSGNVEIQNTSKKDTRTAGIISCILSLISFCSELTDNKNRIIPLTEIENDNISLQTIQYIIGSISLNDFLQHLFSNIHSIVGEDYYTIFQKKIRSESFTTEDILTIEEDPELQEHIGLMVWFALTRLFIESVYFYFDSTNHNIKNPLS